MPGKRWSLVTTTLPLDNAFVWARECADILLLHHPLSWVGSEWSFPSFSETEKTGMQKSLEPKDTQLEPDRAKTMPHSNKHFIMRYRFLVIVGDTDYLHEMGSGSWHTTSVNTKPESGFAGSLALAKSRDS